jgi:hypothetical protein
MAKSLQLSFIGLLVFCGLLLVLGLLLPRGWESSRFVLVQAAPEDVYEHVADFRNWEHWANWNTRDDPGLQIEFSGASIGEGAVMSWQGERLGTGRFSITQADPQTGIHYEAVINDQASQSSITFKDTADGTLVTWTTSGQAAHIWGPFLTAYIAEAWGEQKTAALNNLAKLHEPEP